MVRRFALLLPLVACAPETPVPMTSQMYDCRGDPAPERTSSVPLGCINDPTCDARMVTGHRGAGGSAGLYAPENSLAAVRFAILAGVDVIEIDVRETADDEIVVMHDSDLTRTTDDDRQVSDLTLDELRSVPLNGDGYPGDHNCARVPSFADVLALARGRINIDVDTKTNRADLVAQEIRDADMIDQAFVSAAETAKLVLARQTVPQIKLQARPDTVADYEALNAELDRPPEILEVPVDAAAEFVPIADDIGSKLFTNVFFSDFVAYLDGDLTVYAEAYEDGHQILQTEFPTFLIDLLERRTWTVWPPHRVLELGESPLLVE